MGKTSNDQNEAPNNKTYKTEQKMEYMIICCNIAQYISYTQQIHK